MPERDHTAREQVRGFGPISPDLRVNLADAVARTLRAALLSGELEPGQRILQERLAEELGVSRAPVRDALRRLRAEGLLIDLANGGIAVREFTHEERCENYLLRSLLEGEAARLASTAIRDEEIDELEATNELLRRAMENDDPVLVLDLNDRFHRLFREGARQQTLSEFIEILWTRMVIKTRVLIPGRAPNSVVEHGKIISALRSRAPDAACEAAQYHVETACREYLEASGLSATPALEDWLLTRAGPVGSQDSNAPAA